MARFLRTAKTVTSKNVGAAPEAEGRSVKKQLCLRATELKTGFLTNPFDSQITSQL